MAWTPTEVPVATWGVENDGDVDGPASSTDNAIARYNGTTGKIIQDSGVLIDDSDNVTGVVSLTMSGTFTDGTASLTAGAFTGLTFVNAVTATELSQLETIAATTISEAQWGYVGGADQAVKQADSPTFVGLTLSGAVATPSSVTATTFTDGTFSVTAGVFTGVASIATPTSITMFEDGWIGIGAALERIVFDGTGDAIVVTAAKLGVGITPVSMTHVYENTAEVGPAAGVTIEQDGAGDAVLQFLLSGVERWMMGIDNDDGQAFVIGETSQLGSTNYVRMDPASGLTQFPNAGGVQMDTTNRFYCRDSALGMYSQSDSNLTVFADGSIHLNSPVVRMDDNDALTIGTDNDVTMVYDNTDFKITTDANAASDFIVDCGTAKTMELAEAVWMDDNFSAGEGSLPASSIPGVVTFTDNLGADTGISTRGYAVDEGLSYATEINHHVKTASDFYFHLHIQGDAAPTGTDKIKFQIDYTITRDGTTCAPVTTITAEIDFDTQYQQELISFAVTSGTGLEITDQIKCVLTRIAASADEYGGEAKLVTFGVHSQVDTLGSRTLLAK